MRRKMLFVIGVLLVVGGLTIATIAISGTGVQAKGEQSVEPENGCVLLQPEHQGGGMARCEEEIGPSPTPTPPFTIALDAGQHCVIEIDPIQPGESASNIRPIGCFATFAEAIAAATGGEVQLPANVGPAEVTAEMLAPAQNNIVIGIDYVNSNFQGNTLVWETAYTPGCSDGTTFGAPNMPSGWNDVVSSARSYAGCNHYYHYEHTWWTGAVRDCGGSCATMGVMDNATSSERWTP